MTKLEINSIFFKQKFKIDAFGDKINDLSIFLILCKFNLFERKGLITKNYPKGLKHGYDTKALTDFFNRS